MWKAWTGQAWEYGRLYVWYFVIIFQITRQIESIRKNKSRFQILMLALKPRESRQKKFENSLELSLMSCAQLSVGEQYKCEMKAGEAKNRDWRSPISEMTI